VTRGPAGRAGRDVPVPARDDGRAPPREDGNVPRDVRPPALGTLYGVGVGPGDPELITLKGLRVLRTVATVYVPASPVGRGSLARAIAAEHLDATHQRIVELPFAMRASPERMAAQWRANAAAIAEGLVGGADAAFLTEGDPMLYSTFVHVAGALRELRPDARVVVVPGVSSVNAAAAVVGMPLADRDERLAVLPATFERDGLREVLRSFETVVLLKVASAVDRVIDDLEALGLVDAAVCVERCGWPEERVVRDVRVLRGAKLDYFSLMIVRARR
jgi:precorrin-2/cobalt-factor-2 C20-methyltransferase